MAQPGIIFLFLMSYTLSAQWFPTKGPVGNYLDFQYYANDSIYSYFSNGNGLFRTENEGNSWIRLDQGLPVYYSVIGFHVAGMNIFLSYSNAISYRTGFAFSDDGGNHWVERPLPYFDWYAHEFAFLDGVLYAEAEHRLIESSDLGITWKHSSLGDRLYNSLVIKSNKSACFVSDRRKIYRRNSGDTTWSLVYNEPGYFDILHVSDKSLLIIKDQLPGSVSLDNGQSWGVMNLNTKAYLYENVLDFGDSLYFGNSDHLYKSLDDGRSWSEIHNFRKDSLKFKFLMKCGNAIIWSDLNKGILKSRDEFKSHENASNGIYSDLTSSMVITDSFLIVVKGRLLYRYHLENNSWNNVSLLYVDHLSAMRYFNKVLYVLSSGNNILHVSKDEGLTFTQVKLDSFPKSFVASHFLNFGDKLILIGDGVKKFSEDNGSTWQNFQVRDLKGSKLDSYDYFVLNDKLWVIVFNPEIDTRYLFSSPDLISWTLEKSFVTNPYMEKFISISEDFFFQSVFGLCQVLKYDTLSNEFIRVEGIQNACNIKFLKWNDKIIAFAHSGYYISIDQGYHWIKVFDELCNTDHEYFNDLEINGNKLFASTRSFGVLQTDLDLIKTGKINVFLFHDYNRNSIYDIGEPPLQNGFINLKKQGQFIKTDDQGRVEFSYASAIQDTLEPILFSVDGVFIPRNTVYHPVDTSLNFAFQSSVSGENVSIELFALNHAKPGSEQFIDLRYSNKGSNFCSGKILFHIDPVFSYVSSKPEPSLQTSQVLIWNFNDSSFLQEHKIRIRLYLPDTVPVHSMYSHRVNLFDLGCNDQYYLDNNDEISDEVQEVESNIEMIVDRKTISFNELYNKVPLIYTVRFQNTSGGTIPSVNLSDELYGFDLSTFKVLSSSHPFSYEISPFKKLLVHFNNIDLADSTENAASSYLYFKYGIVHFPNVDTHFRLIQNRAYITWDPYYGESTNLVITKITDLVNTIDEVGEKTRQILVVPNPVHEEFRLYSEVLNRNPGERIQIFNLNGQCIYEKSDNIIDGYKIDSIRLNPGVYVLKVYGVTHSCCRFVVTN